MVCALALIISVSQSHAQASNLAATMNGRVSPELRAQVMVLVDSAAAASLPSTPLIDKTLEGTSKGIDDHRILTAVQTILASLREARLALGKISDDELTAAASALRAGVPAATLVTMQRSLGDRSLVVPLSVLSALVVQGVAPPAAETAVVTYVQHNDDARMLVYGRDVVREIVAGMAPQVAISAAVGKARP